MIKGRRMQFLKILFWCLLAFVAAVFTISNWNAVQIQLWGGLIADVNLPLLLLVLRDKVVDDLMRSRGRCKLRRRSVVLCRV